MFHRWGLESADDGHDGWHNFTVAIVELPDGKIETPTPTTIQFIDNQQEKAS
jgi:hypothetical protein